MRMVKALLDNPTLSLGKLFPKAFIQHELQICIFTKLFLLLFLALYQDNYAKEQVRTTGHYGSMRPGFLRKYLKTLLLQLQCFKQGKLQSIVLTILQRNVTKLSFQNSAIITETFGSKGRSSRTTLWLNSWFIRVRIRCY